ncbi:hypothetical protein STEG23_024204, partial [Scotinomys teguina]
MEPTANASEASILQKTKDYLQPPKPWAPDQIYSTKHEFPPVQWASNPIGRKPEIKTTDKTHAFIPGPNLQKDKYFKRNRRPGRPLVSDSDSDSDYKAQAVIGFSKYLARYHLSYPTMKIPRLTRGPGTCT